MQSKIEDIANKLGITAIVTTGVETSVITWTVAPTPAKKK
jgi:hypothetical protein